MAGNDSQLRTDYPPAEIYRNRLKESRSEGKKVIQHGVVSVKYSPEFDEFAASAAKSLARYIKYRSDGGRFARGLVRQTPHLRLIHNEYQSMGLRDGAVVKLYAILTRRMHKSPSERWALSVEFYVRVSDADFSDEGFDIDGPSPDALKTTADAFLARAVGIAEDISGNRGKRMIKYIELAERIGYPGFLDLWYYSPMAVEEYATISDEERRKITSETGGRLPFKGRIPGFQYGLNWRVYPFQDSHLNSHPTTTDREIETGLVYMDTGIIKSIQNLTRGPDLAQSNKRLHSELWKAFRRHISELMLEDSSHLYYMWNRYPGYELS